MHAILLMQIVSLDLPPLYSLSFSFQRSHPQKEASRIPEIN